MYNLKMLIFGNPEYVILKGSIFDTQNIEKSTTANFLKHGTCSAT